MPDTGVPPRVPVVPASHASTAEWQSFELRMRRRRVERCIVRAEVALSAGFEDDAGEALAEARRLDAEAPTLEEIRARLDLRPPDASRPARTFRFAPVAAVGLLAFAALGGWSRFYGGRTPDAPTMRAGVAVPEAQLPARPGASVVVRREILRAKIQVADSPEPPVPPPAPDASAASSRESRTADQSAAQPPSMVSHGPERSGEAAPIEAAAAATVPAPYVPAGLPVVPLTPADSPIALAVAAPAAPHAVDASRPVVHPPATAVDTPPAAVDEVARVRSVLTQYERAYSSLDARAARTVWPEVDERALAHAFNGLESQRLTLGRCGVVVDGATAHANCSGSASWIPKVGTGRTEPRRWSFTLQNARGVWRITHATIGTP